MKLKDTNFELYQRYYKELRSMMGSVGIEGLLEVLADLSQDFGDSSYFPIPDSFWLNAAAQIEQTKDRINDYNRRA